MAIEPASTATKPLPPVWLLGLCQGLLGISAGLTLITLPQLLAAKHVPEPAIAGVETWYIIAQSGAFLVSPLLDWKFSRRFYATVLGVLTAVLSFVAFLVLDNIALLSAVIFLSGAAIHLYAAAVGGWTGSIVGTEKRGSLGAWMMVANFGCGGITVMFGIVLLRQLPFILGDGLLALSCVLPLLLFPLIPSVPADKKLASESFRDFFRDIGTLLKAPSVSLMVLFFVLPSATFSLTNILGGLGQTYRASEQFVGMVGGAGQVVSGVIGSLLMPLFLKRIAPKSLYLLVGTVGALFTLTLIALPHTQPIYGLATIGENIFQSASFSVGYAVILIELGQNNRLAATQFAVLNAAQIVPMAYMETIDGNAYGLGQATGLYLTDAGISLIACGSMALLLWALARRKRARRIIDGAALAAAGQD